MICGLCGQDVVNTRAIIRNPGILDGRWTIARTSIAVAQIRADLNRMSRADVLRSYRFMQLTDDELDRIDAFPFDPVREVDLAPTYASVLMGCVCGEDTPVVITETKHIAHCICGRDWAVTVQLSVSLLGEAEGPVA